MAIVGSIREFDISNPGSFELYAEQLKFYLEANEITNAEKKRATFLAVCGIKTIEVIRTLVSPAQISSISFDQIIQLLKDQFCPRSSEIFRRFKFHKRVQGKTESVNAYVTELKKLAEDCGFGNNLSERLRDQIVCGMRDEEVQRKLLAESTLTFDTAVSAARAAEAAASQSKIMHSNPSGSNFFDSVDQVRRDRTGFKKGGHPDSKGTSGNTSPQNQSRRCYSCGGDHERSSCRFRDAVCYSCKIKGHIKSMCRKVKNRTRTNEVGVHEEYLNSVNQFKSEFKQSVDVEIEGKIVKMEVDSGSYYSIMSIQNFRKNFPSEKPSIRKTNVKLKDFQKNDISLEGVCKVTVGYKTYKTNLDLLISKCKCTTILGFSWFQKLGIALTGVNKIESDVIGKILEKYSEVFDENLGTYKGPKISLPINPEFPPIRFKARNVPLALKPKIELALEKLLKENVIEKIDNPKWTTPVVPVLKSSGEVRLCGDYKVTLNKAMNAHPYPIPAVMQLLSNLKGGGYYAKIDLAQAYLQLPVNDASAEAQTIITHKGAFKVKRLQFGVNVAPGVFQNLIEELMSNLEGVVPYFDDVLIRAESKEQLASRLEKVLERLKTSGLKANKAKCLFGVTEVEFLGYRVDKSGIHPSKSKVEAIQSFPIPKDKTQLQAFLGLINFYNVFLRDKATKAETLHRLLDKNSKWEWTEKHTEAFKVLKNLLSSGEVLVPFDEKLPIVLTCDASPVGVGAVLSHVLPDGQEVPIAFGSRTLTSSERNYAQIDKEALGIVFGVKKFHQFLYGHSFTIVTDHQPLLGIFTKGKPTKEILSPRMLRWSILLNAYDFSLIHRPGKKIQHADALSRLPKKMDNCEVPQPLEVLFTEQLEDPPLHASEISKLTVRSPVLSRVLNWVLKGWPDKIQDPKLKKYFVKRNELSVHRNCLLWGNRVIVPVPGRLRVLKSLHICHPGIERMKALARSYVWWPGIDEDISSFVSGCQSCQLTRHSPPKAPVHPWEIPSKPWSRLHVDFAGPFQGETFLILIDAFSKWIEVRRTPSTTSSATINILRDIFSTHGIPHVLVSDNGTQFTSQEFKDFLFRNSIRQVLIAPRRPAANGQAERTVQTVKDALRKVIKGSWRQRLASYLLQQHVTPSTHLGASPSELLMGRRLRTILDDLHPDLTEERRTKQETDYELKFGKSVTRFFNESDPVSVKNFGQGPKWIPATVIKATGPVSYEVLTEDGVTLRRHVDQMLKSSTGYDPSASLSFQEQPSFPEDFMPPIPERVSFQEPPNPMDVPTSSSEGPLPEPEPAPTPPSSPTPEITIPQQPPTSRTPRPRRNVRPPKRYGIDDFTS